MSFQELKECYKTIKELNDQLEKAEAVIGFYGDPENYGDSEDICRPTGNKCFDVILFDFDRSFKKNKDYGGKRAREYFKEKGEL